MVIDRPNQVWAADITYVPIGRGFLYLVAIMDWTSRAVLAWRLSNSMDVSFCVSALEEALARFGKPGIFNTDQGSQFTSMAFTGVLLTAGDRGVDGWPPVHFKHWKCVRVTNATRATFSGDRGLDCRRGKVVSADLVRRRKARPARQAERPSNAAALRFTPTETLSEASLGRQA